MYTTLPPVDFTLMMFDNSNSKKDIIDNTLPTIFSLVRATLYDFDALPSNMYTLPFANEEHIRTSSISNNYYTEEFKKATYEYIKYLHALNPKSTFNMIAFDLAPEDGILPLYCNGLDPKQNQLTLITDGGATPYRFRNIYGDGSDNDNSLDTYNTYVKKWEVIKKNALSKNLNFANLEKTSKPFETGQLCLYPYLPVMANDESISFKWVVARKDTGYFGSSEVFTSKMQNNSNIVRLNMGDYLKFDGSIGLIQTDNIENLKRLLNFNNEAVVKAENEGKTPIIFLGTSTPIEKAEETTITNRIFSPLDDMLLFTKSYFDNDKYAFFYKGHPGHIYTYPQRDKILENLGFTALDATIPAEFFYFFDKKITMCGYGSSTFTNISLNPLFTNDKAYTSEIYIGGRDDNGCYTIEKNGKTALWDPKNPTIFNFN